MKLQPITAFLLDLLEVVKCSWVNKVSGEEEEEEEKKNEEDCGQCFFTLCTFSSLKLRLIDQNHRCCCSVRSHRVALMGLMKAGMGVFFGHFHKNFKHF